MELYTRAGDKKKTHLNLSSGVSEGFVEQLLLWIESGRETKSLPGK